MYKKNQNNDENFWISYADLMAGLLFVFILVIGAIVIKYVYAQSSLESSEEAKSQLFYELAKTKNLYESTKDELDKAKNQINLKLSEIEKLKAAKIPVITVCCGACSSMASIILAAGTKGKRYTYPHGRIMIHRPSYPDGIDDGTIDGLDIMKNELSVTSDIMCEMLMKYTGKSKKIIKEAISSDNFMSAAEAKKFGIVDKLDTFIA
jgi:ATP-dependent Clp endopeptidase proteolytic subunit ClpP